MSSVQPRVAEVARGRRSSWVPLAIGLAIPFGVVGLLVGAFLPSLLEHGAPDFSIAVLTASTIGAGIGWFVGASIGYWVRRKSPPTSEVQVWALRIVAVIVVLTGLWMANGVLAGGAYGPMIDGIAPEQLTRRRASQRPRAVRWASVIRMSAGARGDHVVVLAHRRALRPAWPWWWSRGLGDRCRPHGPVRLAHPARSVMVRGLVRGAGRRSLRSRSAGPDGKGLPVRSSRTGGPVGAGVRVLFTERTCSRRGFRRSSGFSGTGLGLPDRMWRRFGVWTDGDCRTVILAT